MGDSTHEGLTLEWSDGRYPQLYCHRRGAGVYTAANISHTEKGWTVYLRDSRSTTVSFDNLAEAKRYAEVTYLLTR
jgi:hypothetical protein